MQEKEQEWPFKSLFVPLTTLKAIHIIVIVGFIVFGNMLFNDFVYDDKTYILFNTEIHAIDFLKLIGHSLFNAGGQYRPIPALYFATLYSLFKETPFFYHLFQLTFHIINASLVFVLFKRFINLRLSLLLSLIFLVHPIQIESVSYIASTGNALFFFFGMTALILSLKKDISWKRFSLIFFLLLMSLLTKETGMLFMVMILLYRFLSVRKNIVAFVFFSFLTLFIYAFIRFAIGGAYFMKIELSPIARLSFIERVVNIPEIIFYYLKTVFYPVDLSIGQNWVIRHINFQKVYFPLLICSIVFISLTWIGKNIFIIKRKNFLTYFFFFIWFLVGLFMHTQIFPLDLTVADRWFYFPMVGLLGLIGILIETKAFSSKNTKVIHCIIVVAIILLGIRTIDRNRDWSNAITLYTHDLQVSDSFDIQSNLGVEYSNQQNYVKAIEHYKKSIELFPYEANLYNLANTYEKIGETKMAEKYYLEASRSKHYLPIKQKHFSVTYIRLAYMLYLNGKCERAKEVIQNGLQEYPSSGYLWVELAACEYKSGNKDTAFSVIEKAKGQLSDKQTNDLYHKITSDKLLVL